MIILNRVLEWDDDGIQIEADPRHVELILRDMGMEKCNGSTCIADVDGREEEGDEQTLTSQEATSFRSIVARCNFLAADRVDIQFACKEVCRRMSAPTSKDWVLLKKVCRYLRARPRCVMRFDYQCPPAEVYVVVDGDYVGCRRTRRSTNGGVCFWGQHVVKTWASTQSVVALSSGEAEFYGVVRGACEGLGVAALAEDLQGARMTVGIGTDSSAAKGIASRRGLGKVKHLETRTLWLQDHVARGSVLVRKVPGECNVADMLTKFLSANKLAQLLEDMPVRFIGGRSRLVPALQQ